MASNKVGLVTSQPARLIQRAALNLAMKSGELIIFWENGGILERAPTVSGPGTDAATSYPFSTAPSETMP